MYDKNIGAVATVVSGRDRMLVLQQFVTNWTQPMRYARVYAE
jgi:hypothetical protein